MKKMINTSFMYLILALVAGVFYREFTKFNAFSGQTALGIVHTHFFILGVIFFLILTLFIKNFPQILDYKGLNKFYILYNISVILFTIMLLVRGTMEVLGTPLSSAVDASISGIAGISHILLTVSLVYFFVIIKKSIVNHD
ncbi:DUF2871 domain-containing protein [Allocoprobacillus halotolerans]|uniref:DUF2871 domain-containing protein n=1 Tax=Allocoprobacillus halotolerans TaxID=2944914 RepID=A0ABY5I7L4_9FIRM|nr:DUF2871 domain-containing protein [Allocoprobacillus halotolerans]UTY39917.1 DUF2871 domain-containing protein [Allocoprobacillus halotolerans]